MLLAKRRHINYLSKRVCEQPSLLFAQTKQKKQRSISPFVEPHSKTHSVRSSPAAGSHRPCWCAQRHRTR